jgi:hypothetical protein
MGYTASKCHNRFSEVEKLRRSLSRFCYNALPNLISQYTKNRSNVLILVGIVSAKYKNYKKQDNVGYYGYLCYPDIDWTDKETFFEKS